MKRTLIFTAICALMIFSSADALGQSRKFDGLWSGTMTKDDGETFDLELFIEDNNVYAVTIDDEGDQIKDRYKEVTVSKGFGEQMSFFWMNKGGVWSETQMFSIVWKSSDELSVYHVRHVSNESDSYSEDNTDWGYNSTGILTKD